MLSGESWRAREAAHAARVDALVAPHLARRAGQVKHPVYDFLFTYYSQRPAQLRRWHPGFGVLLEDAPEHAPLKGYDGDPVGVTEAYVASQQRLLRQLHGLLSATASRAPQLSCFGLHEWAMVHRSVEHGTQIGRAHV